MGEIAFSGPLGTGTFTPSMGAGAVDLGPLNVRGVTRTAFRIHVPSAKDPVTGSVQYRVVLVDRMGTPLVEVEDATMGPASNALFSTGSFDFQTNLLDPKIEEIEVAEREVQVWRGSRLWWWGVITRARAGNDVARFQCQTLEWYFGKRVMGPVPRTGHFADPNFEYGTFAWLLNYLPGSKPRSNPLKGHSDFSLSGEHSLILADAGGRSTVKARADTWFQGQSDDLSPNGISEIADIMAEVFEEDPRIAVDVWHDNTLGRQAVNDLTMARAQAIANEMQSIDGTARIIQRGNGEKDPVDTNRTAAGRDANRRLEVHWRNTDGKKGHKQFAYQDYKVKVPPTEQPLRVTLRGWCYIKSFEGPAANNWAMVLERQDTQKPSKSPAKAAAGFKKVYARAVVTINKKTPQKAWMRMETSLVVPNDGKNYIMQARLFPPVGEVYWDEVDLFTDDALDYVDEPQENILRDLVEHAQNPALGKSPLSIGHNIPNSGVPRTRRYPFSERTVILDHLNEFTTLGNGIEWDIQVTPTTRTLTGYFPRKERRDGYSLVLGQNIIDGSMEIDSTSTSSSVIVMANDVESYAREERSAIDPSLTDGISMEIAYLSTPGSPISSLEPQAQRGLERFRKPVMVPTVTVDPAWVDDVLDNVTTGSVVDVDVRVGWFQAITKYRVTEMTLNPNTDALTMTMIPEDAAIVVLSDWGQQWRYFNQAQFGLTGNNSQPVRTNEEFAGRSYDDSGWAVGTAGFGWYQDGSEASVLPDIPAATTIPFRHEVWIRKTVLATEEMYVSLRVDTFAYIYVNGNLVGDYRAGRNFNDGFVTSDVRVPQAFLDPSGVQVVAIHVQDRLSEPGINPRALYADAKIKGIYDENHVAI